MRDHEEGTGRQPPRQGMCLWLEEGVLVLDLPVTSSLHKSQQVTGVTQRVELKTLNWEQNYYILFRQKSQL